MQDQYWEIDKVISVLESQVEGQFQETNGVSGENWNQNIRVKKDRN